MNWNLSHPKSGKIRYSCCVSQK
uniref:Uncharacterized protein n=1 Tax=Anguilla anguilla TaxID=7936 RepID=A0A0E9PXN4_ANGAN